MKIIILAALFLFSTLAQTDMGISASGDVFYHNDSGNPINFDTGEFFPNALTKPSRNIVERSNIGNDARKSNKRNRNRNRYDSEVYNDDAYWQDDDNW